MPASQHSGKISTHTDDNEIVIKSAIADSSTSTTYALQQQALRIVQAMQTTLDVYDLVKRFSKELKAILPFHSFLYKNDTTQHEYQEGLVQPHKATYNLSIEEQSLGEITVTKETPFEPKEIELLENALSQVMYPLKNAIQYHEALVSSLTCALTGLGNRHAYDLAIKRELEFCSRHELDLSLLVCDLDKFKRINDTYGHSAGDMVIKETGQVIAQVCRDSDIVFRIGGEEYVIILKNTDPEGAKTLADRIRHALKEHAFVWQDQALHLTISVGISHLTQNDTTQSLFERADGALYSAKRKGGNHSIVE